MIKIEAKKDGKGNIVISETSFEMLLACLDNQKFVHEAPKNGDSLSVGEDTYKQTQENIQKTIDEYNRACRNILHQKYIFSTTENGYFLKKNYEHQEELTPWSIEDVAKVREIFKDTKIKWERPKDLLPLDGSEEIQDGSNPIGKYSNGFIVCEPTKSEPWLIERPLRFNNEFLAKSEDGITHCTWKQEEIEMIKKIIF